MPREANTAFDREADQIFSKVDESVRTQSFTLFLKLIGYDTSDPNITDRMTVPFPEYVRRENMFCHLRYNIYALGQPNRDTNALLEEIRNTRELIIAKGLLTPEEMAFLERALYCDIQEEA